MKYTQSPQWPARIGGYLAIPHELLHIIGFRLVGQRCVYQWGQPHVTPLGSIPAWKRLVGRLFPFAVFLTLLIVFTILSGLAYSQALRSGSFFWFILWTSLAYVAGMYAGSTVGDLRRAYLLIFNKPWYSWTPFDFVYWPIVDWDKVREKVVSGEAEELR